MILGDVDLGITVRIATVVVPVAVYFLVLGLLNSRRHPQMLSGRLDFALMIAALSPLFLVPAVDYVGASLLGILGLLLGLAASILLLAPGRGNWVVYNLPSSQARDAVRQVLRRLGLDFRELPRAFRLGDGQEVTLRSFSVLRNVSIRLRTRNEALLSDFEGALSATLRSTAAETSPTAVSFLLVATAMLVAPVSLVAHRVPEIVRILTDLL